MRAWKLAIPGRNSDIQARIADAKAASRRMRARLRIEKLEQRKLLAAQILDAGFENPVQPDNEYEKVNGAGSGTLVGSHWTMTGGAGITRNISAFQSGGITRHFK